ncbi:MAG: cardiolipin synthase [Bacteroides sp.]|nr:cardiolipin synthase [Bacteroides sp.]MCM1412856.1 cardiolipin synthase [Bacteroides sp.]MCM1471525.1 cardiolipin synthase [Bacteroides sp.]
MIIASINMTWVYALLTIAYVATIATIVGIILAENRNPLKSLAWITVLMTLPIGGIILYLFFGRSIKNTHMISRRNKRRLRQSVAQVSDEVIKTADTPDHLQQQIELGMALTESTVLPSNHIKVFHDGTEKFDSLLADIANAHHYIHLQYYIFSDDRLGNCIKDALIDAARRGVKVRVIYDHIGSLGTKRRFFKEMEKTGIECHPFFRVVFPLFATRINWRNHRKIVVVDGSVGYIGGMNIADRYIDGGKFDRWRDTHLRISGPGVAAMQYVFAVDWSFMGNPLIEESANVTPYTGRDAANVQLITSGPTSEWSNIAMVMFRNIANARKRVYIQTPYFLPTENLMRALEVAALSRVDVRIMIPRRSDSLILTYASYSYIMEALRAGIKVYLYNGGMLHSKTMIIDDDISSVGSANIDFRSFEHNFESTLFIYSHDTNSELTRQFMDDLHNSEKVSESRWRNRPMWQKALESILRLLSPVL